MWNPLAVRKIKKNGIPARGVIVAMSTPQAGASSQNLALTLQKQVEGRPPYEVEDQWMVPSSATLGHGLALPCKVDAKDQTRVAIDWDAAEAEQEAEEVARRAALAEMPPVGSGGAGMPAMPGMGGLAGGQVIDASNSPELRAQVLAALQAQGIDVSQVSGVEVPPAQPPAAAEEADPIDRLAKLAELRDKGILSPTEFEAQKVKLLGEI